jgi:hypothetical protein
MRPPWKATVKGLSSAEPADGSRNQTGYRHPALANGEASTLAKLPEDLKHSFNCLYRANIRLENLPYYLFSFIRLHRSRTKQSPAVGQCRASNPVSRLQKPVYRKG